MNSLSFFLIAVCLLKVVYGQEAPSVCISCDQHNYERVNLFRRDSGLLPLEWSTKLANRAIAQSMVNYQNNIGFVPDTTNMEANHSDWAGENVAWSYNVHNTTTIGEAFWFWWQNSEPHRLNQMNVRYGCMGVGIYGDGDLFMGTQAFGLPDFCDDPNRT